MDPDQRLFEFLMKWAEQMGCTFIVQACDGNEPDDLIDGMAVDDVWGWLVPMENPVKSDQYFGCAQWSLENGKLKIDWTPYKG